MNTHYNIDQEVSDYLDRKHDKLRANLIKSIIDAEGREGLFFEPLRGTHMLVRAMRLGQFTTEELVNKTVEC